MTRPVLAFCSALILGCAAHAGHPHEAPPQTAAATTEPSTDPSIDPSTEPSTNALPMTWKTVKFDAPQPLAKLDASGESTQFAYKLKTAGRTLYFGEIQNADEQMLPVIAVRVGRSYKAIKVAGDYSYDQWVSVMSGPRPTDVWGVLDQSTDPQAEDDDRQTDEFTIVHSTDGGETFQLAVVRKVCRKASFSDFVMARNGHGRFTLALNENCGKHKPGLYHYRTTDGGKTFSRPQYEADATTPADDVPDDEQPNQENQSARSDALPRPRYAGGEGGGEGVLRLSSVSPQFEEPLTPDPSPLSTGARGTGSLGVRQ